MQAYLIMNIIRDNFD